MLTISLCPDLVNIHRASADYMFAKAVMRENLQSASEFVVCSSAMRTDTLENELIERLIPEPH